MICLDFRPWGFVRREIIAISLTAQTRSIQVQLAQCCRKLISAEPKWSRLAFVGHTAVLINQIDSVRPAGVGLLGGVAEFIEHGGKFDAELAHTRSRDFRPLIFILRAGKNDFVFDVALHLPDVAGMCLSDVHDQEGDLVLVLIVKFVKGGNLPPEWRSSITAENHDDWLSVVKFGKLDGSCFVELGQCEIRG